MGIKLDDMLVEMLEANSRNGPVRRIEGGVENWRYGPDQALVNGLVRRAMHAGLMDGFYPSKGGYAFLSDKGEARAAEIKASRQNPNELLPEWYHI